LSLKSPGHVPGLFRCDLLWKWPDKHDHLTAFHLGEVFDPAKLFGVFGNTFQQLTAQFLVRHFPAAETQGHLHLVPVFEELEDVAHFHIVVVAIRVWTELHFFNFDGFLLFARLSFFLLSLVFELAIVHDFADRRICVWRDLYQIEARVFGHSKGPFRAHYTDIFTFSADQANLCRTDAFIDTWSGVALGRRVVGSACYGLCPLIVNDIAIGNLRACCVCFNRKAVRCCGNFPCESSFAWGQYHSYSRRLLLPGLNEFMEG